MEPDPLTAGLQEKSESASAPVEPHRLAVNYLYLSAGEFTAKLLTFASFSYLARVLGPAQYGPLEFTLAVMVFFTLPTDLGLAIYGVREVARNPDRGERLLREITGLRMALTLCSMIGLAVFILVIHKSAELKELLALYGASLLAGPFLLQWFFQAYDRMNWVGITSIVRQTVFVVLVFLIYRRGTPLLYVGLVECASVAGAAAFCFYVTRHQMGFGWPWPDLHVTRLLGHVKEAAPIGLNELAWACMWYFPTVLLGFLVFDRTLGWFGASHRAVMALHTFVYLYFFNLLPSISRCVALPRTDLLQLMDRSIRFAAWAGFFAAALLTAVAPNLLGLLYGPQYRSASGSFAILVWMLPIALLSGHHRYILIAYNRQVRLLGCTAVSAAAVVVFGLVLTPLYGGPGAAWALLAAITMNFVLVYVSVRQLVVEVPVHRQLTIPLMALAVSAGVYLTIAKLNVWMALAVASAMYVGILAWKDGAQLISFVRAIVRNHTAIPVRCDPA